MFQMQDMAMVAHIITGPRSSRLCVALYYTVLRSHRCLSHEPATISRSWSCAVLSNQAENGQNCRRTTFPRQQDSCMESKLESNCPIMINSDYAYVNSL